MADITASLRLRFLSDDTALRRSLSVLRDVKNSAMAGARQGGGGSVLGLENTGKTLAFAGNLNQAASAMQGLKAQIDGVTRGPIDKFANFELMMARVKARTDNLSDEGFANLNKIARDLGKSTAFSATQAAEGLFELAGAGLTAEQQMAALPATLQLAQSGQVAIAEAASLAINTMAQFGLTVADLPEINDVLNQAANASTISLSDLGETFKYVGPLATKAGLDVLTMGKYTALLGNAGIVGSQAGTALRAMLSRLATQSPRAKKALQEVGVSGKDAAEGLKDPIGFLQKLAAGFSNKKLDAAKQLSVLMRVFGDEAGPAVAAILEAGTKLGTDGTTGFDKMSEAMDNYRGSTQRAADAVDSTTANRIKEWESALEELQLTIGESLAPTLTNFQKDLGPLIESFGRWARENPQLVTSMGRVLLISSGALAVLAPMALAVASLTTVWAALGPAVRLGTAPLRMVGGLLAGSDIVNGTAKVRSLGDTWTGTAGKMRVAGGVLMAAMIGWEIGTLIDGWTAKILGLKEATLSASLAVAAADSKGFNDTVARVADAVGLTGLADAARANQRINEERDAQGGVTRTRGQPATKVQVEVNDNRTVVKTTQGTAPASTLRTGSN